MSRSFLATVGWVVLKLLDKGLLLVPPDFLADFGTTPPPNEGPKKVGISLLKRGGTNYADLTSVLEK